MNFANPHMLWLLLAIPPALVAFFWWSARARQRLLTQFIQARLLPTLTDGNSAARLIDHQLELLPSHRRNRFPARLARQQLAHNGFQSSLPTDEPVNGFGNHTSVAARQVTPLAKRPRQDVRGKAPLGACLGRDFKRQRPSPGR